MRNKLEVIDKEIEERLAKKATIKTQKTMQKKKRIE